MFTWLSRTVASHDCRHIFLLQLFKPKDEKLDQFWIDFNVESECVSFFVDDPQVCIINNPFFVVLELWLWPFSWKNKPNMFRLVRTCVPSVNKLMFLLDLLWSGFPVGLHSSVQRRIESLHSPVQRWRSVADTNRRSDRRSGVSSRCFLHSVSHRVCVFSQNALGLRWYLASS